MESDSRGPFIVDEPEPPGSEFPRTDPFRVAVIATAIVAAVGAAVVFSLFVVFGAKEPVAIGSSPAATTSARATAEDSAAPSASDPARTIQPTFTPSATPEPIQTPPPGPPARLNVGWARSDVKLNVRTQADLQSDSVTQLRIGEVVWISAAALPADGYSWYPVSSVRGPMGWIASGPASNPYASMVSTEMVFPSCGRVQADDEIMVAGLDPGTLDDAETGAFEIAAAVGREACVTFALADDRPTAYVSVSAEACGEPIWDGAALRLAPTLAGNVIDESRVKSTLIIRSGVLTEKATPGPDGMTNRLKVLILADRLEPAFACVAARVTETVDDRDTYFQSQVTGCFVVAETYADHVLLAASDGLDPLWFGLPAHSVVHSFPIGISSGMNVTAAWTRYEGEFFSLIENSAVTC